jgi:serine/threonine protein kinase
MPSHPALLSRKLDSKPPSSSTSSTMDREILFQNRLLLLGNLDSAKLPLGCYLCTPSSSKDPVDYILAYDTHASARARTPTYLVLARTSCDTLGFKEKIYPSSDKLCFMDRDAGCCYHVLEQVRPDEVHAPEKELRRITEEGRNIVLLHPIDPGKTWFAQDLSAPRGKEQKSPSFVVVNRFDHTEGWQFAVAAHSSSSQHARVSSLLYHIDFRQNVYSLLVTKYIQGETLLADLQRNYSVYLKRPDYAKRILIQLIEVVNWLHDRGVYHR